MPLFNSTQFGNAELCVISSLYVTELFSGQKQPKAEVVDSIPHLPMVILQNGYTIQTICHIFQFKKGLQLFPLSLACQGMIAEPHIIVLTADGTAKATL